MNSSIKWMLACCFVFVFCNQLLSAQESTRVTGELVVPNVEPQAVPDVESIVVDKLLEIVADPSDEKTVRIEALQTLTKMKMTSPQRERFLLTLVRVAQDKYNNFSDMRTTALQQINVLMGSAPASSPVIDQPTNGESANGELPPPQNLDGTTFNN